jgi:MFS family permease
VFFLTAAVTLPAVVSLMPLRRLPDPALQKPGHGKGSAAPRVRLRSLLTNRALLIFALCAMLFTLGNSAMLPLAANALTKKAGDAASLLIGACIVLPQLVVAVISPTIGQLAEARGRRLVLLLGLFTLPIRGLLFARLSDPTLLVVIQALDGIAAACLGILVPLVTSDIAGHTGRFNLSLGFVGLAIGIGATASTSLAGRVADSYGSPVAFACLAGFGLAALLLAWLAMPETRPAAQPE